MPPPQRVFSQRSITEKAEKFSRVGTALVSSVATTARIVAGIASAGRVANAGRAVGVAAASARAAAAVAAVGGAVAGLGGTVVGVAVVNVVLNDDARLPPTERRSRAAARIVGSVAATTAALGSGIAASVAVEGVAVLAGGTVAGGIAVAAVIPAAAALVLGFGAYGVHKSMAKSLEAKRAHFLRVLSTRKYSFATADATSILRSVLKAHLAAVPDDDYAQMEGAIALQELE